MKIPRQILNSNISSYAKLLYILLYNGHSLAKTEGLMTLAELKLALVELARKNLIEFNPVTITPLLTEQNKPVEFAQADDRVIFSELISADAKIAYLNSLINNTEIKNEAIVEELAVFGLVDGKRAVAAPVPSNGDIVHLFDESRPVVGALSAKELIHEINPNAKKYSGWPISTLLATFLVSQMLPLTASEVSTVMDLICAKTGTSARKKKFVPVKIDELRKTVLSAFKKCGINYQWQYKIDDGIITNFVAKLEKTEKFKNYSDVLYYVEEYIKAYASLMNRKDYSYLRNATSHLRNLVYYFDKLHEIAGPKSRMRSWQNYYYAVQNKVKKMNISNVNIAKYVIAYLSYNVAEKLRLYDLTDRLLDVIGKIKLSENELEEAKKLISQIDGHTGNI